ncbi:GDSL-type esterase/lipase family protein [Xenorhabdus griffiniae]|uniref:DUF459 domain-containing protein n=1 Tax=Xenorhabdus griffiniae TaxID=351672 RepID=UPI00235A0997|nr:GDSL-type esterase/lipase family protein [Xenorhabdus griffiniae]MDC9604360.1 GDSL-type esterase/lipase family protein [Xenorhabdus griffiniae]
MNFIHSMKFYFILFSFFSLNGYCKALILGDSLTYVYSESYKSLINKNADVFYQVGSGLNRHRYDWFSAIERIDFDKYDLIVISIGTNDFNKEINSIDYSRSIFELIGRIRSKNYDIKIIWISPPFLKNKEHDFLLKNTRYIIKKSLLQLGVTYLDITQNAVLGEKYTGFLDGKKIRTDDGIHITKHGANLVMEYLKLSL